MITDMDFNSICRVCLESNKQTFDIYTSYYSKTNMLYSEMMANCTKIMPSSEDGLPRLICKDCCRQLRRSYLFYVQCEKSDVKLKEYLNKNFKQDGVKNSTIVQKSVFESIKEEDTKNPIEDDKICESEKHINGVFDYSLTNIKKEETKTNTENCNADIKFGVLVLQPQLVSKIILIQTCKRLLSSDNFLADCTFYQKSVNVDCHHSKLGKGLLRPGRKKSECNSSNNADDSCWDDDDDNAVLEEIRSKKCVDISLTQEEKPKKKRGRKKKVYIEGETPELPDSKLPHQCDVCGKILSTKSNLKAHKICHTDLRPYKCVSCPATFRGHSALFQHRKIHTGETPYHCEYCPKQFSRRTGLINHIRMHTGEKLFSCEICFKNFVQSAQLSIHMKRHKGDKSYLCQDCGKGFPIKADLKVHQRTHNGEKPYACHLCTKTFATSGNLSIHVRIHNKEIRYNCKVCHRGFVTRSAFNVHVKRHKGQRDYHCECGKTFYTSSALKQHKVVHTGEKKYQCKICERKFTQTSHLSRHFKRDHIKPDAPVPSSDHYKTVLQDSVKVLNMYDGTIQKIASFGVKCENS